MTIDGSTGHVAPEELVESVAKRLAKRQTEVFTARYAFGEYVGMEQQR